MSAVTASPVMLGEPKRLPQALTGKQEMIDMLRPMIYDLRALPDRPRDFVRSDEDLSFLRERIADLVSAGHRVFFVLARERRIEGSLDVQPALKSK